MQLDSFADSDSVFQRDLERQQFVFKTSEDIQIIFFIAEASRLMETMLLNP